MRHNLRWYLWVCMTVAAMVPAWFLGFFDSLMVADVTYIGFGIFGMYFASTLWVGVGLWRGDLPGVGMYHVASSMEKLGMTGTVIGFIYAFSAMFSNIDLSNHDAVISLLAVVGTGVATALYTTLVGMVCALALETQLEILGVEYEAS